MQIINLHLYLRRYSPTCFLTFFVSKNHLAGIFTKGILMCFDIWGDESLWNRSFLGPKF